MTRSLVTFMVLLFSFSSVACDESEDSEISPFAVLNDTYRLGKVMHYQLFAPKMRGEYSLTWIYMYKPDELHLKLHFTDASTYPAHMEAEIGLDPELINQYVFYLNYSTTKDGSIVMCGGNIIELNLAELLKVERPPEVIPPPKVTR
ncbi:hypothetical protein [Pseudoalteromonas luteoviolacea]|uniref:Lipoprotein n=1 Tax=Pseudoalteromonas luteoviolacea S4060-1 TaxID=1365257 RepID=A0A167PEC8_9GAMM|nr:hypothetical protein [Pseudoalteromonas luteoviolacea]KZN70450.1 hypothetical protein N478_00675 [Pseudoalteromonas luteoviolacea S4060-1]